MMRWHTWRWKCGGGRGAGGHVVAIEGREKRGVGKKNDFDGNCIVGKG
jgi:hypothetical protein